MPATVLIVEDHSFLRQTLREWLEIRFPGCHILEAASGEEALTMVQTHSPNLIIMDIGLPGMNGLEAAGHVKVVAPATQVVMLTSYNNEDHLAHATAIGASAYVWKDKMLTELRPTLAALLPP